eukprot:TRINITY_DN9731_c0_g2_i1.p1 TRINITY_DN9731_c0_g2~~TRINITY_DN9731_c0_g2_i1.p1  ORF type:complete len:746 (+),score=110.33 TRINITY_DN9731_c0_g2_i1:135-2372(+)
MRPSRHSSRELLDVEAAYVSGSKEVREQIEALSQGLESQRFETSAVPPWLDENGEVIWNPFRIAVARIVRLQIFESFMGVVIATNIVLMIFEADREATCYPTYTEANVRKCANYSENSPLLSAANIIFLGMYTVEGFLRMYVGRFHYFKNNWNLLDFTIMITGWIEKCMGDIMMVNISFLRALRVARLFRAFRIVLSIRELYLLLNGLASSVKAVFYGAIMLFAMLALWSIVLVVIVHPINVIVDHHDCPRCARAYMSVSNSILTLFQTLVVGDSWGEIAIPIIDKEPWTFAIFILIMLTVSLGLMNLILAVVVESAAENREKDVEQRWKCEAISRMRQKADLLDLCQEIDSDQNGTLTLEELLTASTDCVAFRHLMAEMGIGEKDISQVFNLLDADDSGDVDYSEFVDHVYQLRFGDEKLLLGMTKGKVLEVQKELSRVRNEVRAIGSAQQEMLSRNAKLLENIFENILCCSSEERTQTTLRAQPQDLPGPQVNTSKADVSSQTCKLSPCELENDGMCRNLDRLRLGFEELLSLETETLKRVEGDMADVFKDLKCMGSSSADLCEDEIVLDEKCELPQTLLPTDRLVQDVLEQMLEHMKSRISRLWHDVSDNAEVLTSGARLLEALRNKCVLPTATHVALFQPPASSLSVACGDKPGLVKKLTRDFCCGSGSRMNIADGAAIHCDQISFHMPDAACLDVPAPLEELSLVAMEKDAADIPHWHGFVEHADETSSELSNLRPVCEV